MQITPKFTFLETLAVFGATICISLGLALLVEPFVSREYAILVNYASHIPQLLIPWIWDSRRVAPLVPLDQRRLWVWPAGTLRPLLKIALWMVGLKLIGSIIEAATTPTPIWVSSGFLPIVLILLFQGVFVGISEEMMVRPGLHQPLSLLVPSKLAG